MTEPESHTFAYLRRIDEKLDRHHSETGARLDRVESRLGRIEDELLGPNGIALRLEDREVETTGLKAISIATSAGSPIWPAGSPSWKDAQKQRQGPRRGQRRSSSPPHPDIESALKRRGQRKLSPWAEKSMT